MSYSPAPVARQAEAQLNYTRVMVMVDGKSLGTIATAEVETLAIQKCEALGIPVVDADMNSGSLLFTLGDLLPPLPEPLSVFEQLVCEHQEGVVLRFGVFLFSLRQLPRV